MARGLLKEEVLAAAKKYSILPEYIYAVVEVETRWKGNLPDGRLKVLFEAHYFFRNLFKISPTLAKDTLAKYPSICSKAYNHKLYTTNTGEWERLELAKTINEESAYKSASWGLFQIMGENHQACGYKSVYQMVSSFDESESNQLNAFIKFLTSRDMFKPLQKGDFITFVKKYNGPKFATNDYLQEFKIAVEKYKQRLKE